MIAVPCRSCAAPIAIAVLDNGEHAAIDAKPSPGATIDLTPRVLGQGPDYYARVVPAGSGRGDLHAIHNCRKA